MASKQKKILTYLTALFFSLTPFSCQKESPPPTNSKTEQLLSFEKELYQRKLNIRREIKLKDFKLCQSITPSNHCQEIDALKRNQTAYLLTDFDLIGLKRIPLTKEVMLNYSGKKRILSSEIISFPQEDNLQTKATVLIGEKIPLGYSRLEFILKDPQSHTSASLTKKIEIEEGLTINNVQFCGGLEKNKCLEPNNHFSEEKRRIYFLLEATSYDEDLEKLILKGSYTISDPHGHIIRTGKLNYKRKNSKEIERVGLSGIIPIKKNSLLGGYTLKIKLKNPGLNLIAQEESKFNLTGLRISNFKFCGKDHFTDRKCQTGKTKFKKEKNQPLTVFYSFYAESDDTSIKATGKLKRQDQILFDIKDEYIGKYFPYEEIRYDIIALSGEINFSGGYNTFDRHSLEMNVENSVTKKDFERDFYLVSDGVTGLIFATNFRYARFKIAVWNVNNPEKKYYLWQGQFEKGEWNHYKEKVPPGNYKVGIINFNVGSRSMAWECEKELPPTLKVVEGKITYLAFMPGYHPCNIIIEDRYEKKP